MTKLRKVKKEIDIVTEQKDLKISLMPFFIKAVSNSLLHNPILNTRLDEKCENIINIKAHHIGIAMDTKVGLVVPVIKSVETLGIVDIAKELNRLMKSGKEGVFPPNDLTGGSFTISNIGTV